MNMVNMCASKRCKIYKYGSEFYRLENSGNRFEMKIWFKYE